MKFKNLLSFVVLIAIQTTLYAQGTRDETFTIENYYKAKWGYAEEFINLYKKNHYPLLKKALEKGDLISIKADKPRQHASEDGRWDYRVTLVFKNMQAAFDPNLTEPYKLKKEEQRRFEILLAHWDVEIQSVDLEK